ncbi:transferase family-domain-containing protein [Aspergillus bertholletiae]|uniref:Transferase family-domain-containing protein n=1 Tax=Aspergillus bertholletiae TaxID=1226010 RepID=A0A5N7ASE9_9EURO|nr:transferase family-domain-containing protein [Aspergillus bertholletiae]
MLRKMFQKMFQSPSFKPYVLTPLDHSTAPTHFSFFVSFLCQHPTSGLSVLEKGVQRLNTLLPFLSGNLVPSIRLKGKKNAFEVQPTDPSHLNKLPMLKIKQHAQCISPHNANMNTPALSPDDLFNSRYMPLPFCIPASEPQPLLRLQANVMTDGIVLCLSFHHFAVDGLGLSSIMQALSECCRNPDQSPERLSTSPEREAQSRTRIFQSTNESHQAMYDGYGSYLWKAAPSADLGAPISRRFCLDTEKIRRLREACTTTINTGNHQAHRINPSGANASGQGFSNNEVVTALIWLCGMRARSRATSIEGDRSSLADRNSSLLFAADVREILGIPSTYMGNAIVTPTSTYHFKGTELHDVDPLMLDSETSDLHEFNPNDITLLANLALSVQKEFHSINLNYVQNVISHIMASKDWHLPANPGDLSVSSLRRVRVYDMDFGPCLGTPYDFDIPDNRTDGLGWITPPRSDSSARLIGYQSRGFWEVRLSLNPVAMYFLRSDRLWRQVTFEKAITK